MDSSSKKQKLDALTDPESDYDSDETIYAQKFKISTRDFSPTEIRHWKKIKQNDTMYIKIIIRMSRVTGT